MTRTNILNKSRLALTSPLRGHFATWMRCLLFSLAQSVTETINVAFEQANSSCPGKFFRRYRLSLLCIYTSDSLLKPRSSRFIRTFHSSNNRCSEGTDRGGAHSYQCETPSHCEYMHVSEFTYFQAVYLVGGFAASPYLISTLKQRLASTGVTVSVPDAQT